MVKSVQDQRAKKKDTLTRALHLNLGERVGREQGGSWGETERKEEEEVEEELERGGGHGRL